MLFTYKQRHYHAWIALSVALAALAAVAVVVYQAVTAYMADRRARQAGELPTPRSLMWFVLSYAVPGTVAVVLFAIALWMYFEGRDLSNVEYVPKIENMKTYKGDLERQSRSILAGSRGEPCFNVKATRDYLRQRGMKDSDIARMSGRMMDKVRNQCVEDNLRNLSSEFLLANKPRDTMLHSVVDPKCLDEKMREKYGGEYTRATDIQEFYHSIEDVSRDCPAKQVEERW